MSLITALTQVISLLRKPARVPADFKGFAASLVEPLRRVGLALKAEGLDYLLDINGWDRVNTTGEWARNLLQYSRDPDPEKIERLLLDFQGRGHRLDHLAAHVDRFKRDAVKASQRLSGEASAADAVEWTTADGPSRWAKLFEIIPTTFKKRLRDGSIRHKKLSPKSYLIAVADLPAKHQSKFRPAGAPPPK